MNSQDMDREARLQAAAEQAEREGAPPGLDTRLDRERLLLRALRQDLAQSLPNDFARRTAMNLARREQRSVPEDWAMTALLGALALAALFYLRPFLVDVLAQVHVPMPSLPWPMVVATLVAIGAAWAVDQGLDRFESKRR